MISRVTKNVNVNLCSHLQVIKGTADQCNDVSLHFSNFFFQLNRQKHCSKNDVSTQCSE